MTFGSLFSGIGGLDLGLERAGMRCVFQVEIDEYCRRVLAKHWPDVRRHDDVRTFPPASPEEWRCDLITGGDPCQPNSNAGSVWKSEHPDLGIEFLRVIATLRPRLVLRENPSRVREDALWPWWRMRNELRRLGYAVLPFRLRACCLGADHQRDRLFLLASLLDSDSKRLSRINGTRLPAQYPGRATVGSPGDARRDGLSAPRICRGSDGVPSRMDRLRGLGNAVYPAAAEWIGRRILEAQA